MAGLHALLLHLSSSLNCPCVWWECRFFGAAAKLCPTGPPTGALSRVLPRILGNQCSLPPALRHGLELDSLRFGCRSLSGAIWRTDLCQPFQRGGRRSQSHDAGRSVSESPEHNTEGALAGKSYTTIKAELLEGASVGFILLDRPQSLNALSEALMKEVVDACQAFDGSQTVRTVHT